MSTESGAADFLNHLERMNQLLEDQLRWTNAQSFSGTDEAGTVNVTLDGQFKLVDVQIEDGLLRLGAETVEQRINEALVDARTSASGGLATQQTQFMASLSGLAQEMAATVDEQLGKLAEMGLLRP